MFLEHLDIVQIEIIFQQATKPNPQRTLRTDADRRDVKTLMDLVTGGCVVRQCRQNTQGRIGEIGMAPAQMLSTGLS